MRLVTPELAGKTELSAAFVARMQHWRIFDFYFGLAEPRRFLPLANGEYSVLSVNARDLLGAAKVGQLGLPASWLLTTQG